MASVSVRASGWEVEVEVGAAVIASSCGCDGAIVSDVGAVFEDAMAVCSAVLDGKVAISFASCVVMTHCSCACIVSSCGTNCVIAMGWACR
jgi:hypothetical protein